MWNFPTKDPMSQNVEFPHEDPMSQNVDSTPTARCQKRSKNFNEKEDELLLLAWLNVSIDPIHGANQKGSTYWSRILEYFHFYRDFASTRNQNSLIHHWLIIQENVNKFCECIEKIEGRKQSGVTVHDKIVKAKKLFKGLDTQKKSFQFLHCWNMLRTQQKWIEKQKRLAQQKSCNKKQKSTINSTPATSTHINLGDSEAPTPDDIPTRPIGNKRAKEALRQGGQIMYIEALDHLWKKKKEADVEKERKKDDRHKEDHALVQAMVAIEQERIAREKRTEER